MVVWASLYTLFDPDQISEHRIELRFMFSPDLSLCFVTSKTHPDSTFHNFYSLNIRIAANVM